MADNVPPAPPPMQPNPGYEFLNDQPQKKSVLPGGGGKKGRIIVAAAGAALLLIIGVIVFSLFNSASEGTKNDLITAVQQQTELVRISEIGTKDAVGDEAKNLAITTQLSLSSAQDDLQTLATKAGAKLEKRTIDAGKDEQTDKDLETAKQINRFDEAFIEVMKEKLLAYQQTLKRVHEAAQNESSKATLSELYDNASVLAEQE